MWAVVFMVLAQVACSPGDPTVVCQCKEGQASACEVLRQSDPQWAEKVQNLVEQARVLKSLDETVPAKAATEASDSTDTSEPPDTPPSGNCIKHELLASSHAPRMNLPTVGIRIGTVESTMKSLSGSSSMMN